MQIRKSGPHGVPGTLLALALCGCAATPTDHHLQNVSARVPATFQLVDDRPETDKQSKQPHLPEGVTQAYSDDNLDPGPIALVEAALTDHASAELAGKTVRITGFHAYVSDAPITVDGRGLNQAMASTPGATPAAGALAALLIYGIEKLRAPKFVTIEISGKVQDAAFSTSVQDTYRGGVSAGNLETTLHKAMDQLATRLAKDAYLAPQLTQDSSADVKDELASKIASPKAETSASDAHGN